MKIEDIYIVIVLYKNSLDESNSIKTLSNCFDENINLFVYDNSPTRQYEEGNFTHGKFAIQYFHDADNKGLSTAYNYALTNANNKNKKWLLLLDQDTYFSRNYIEEIKKNEISELDNELVAIVPNVNSLIDGKKIAPVEMLTGGICRSIETDSGIVKNKISGINSGTLLKIDYLNSIKGFSLDYTLDMLDHWYFRKIFEDRKKIFILNASIKQDLSVLGNFEENVSFNRYKQMLEAECFFMKKERFTSLFVFKLRLFFRVLKQFKFKNKNYYKLTLKLLLTNK
jgi:GT2 family glycosyltransferase